MTDNANGITNANTFEDTVLIVFAQQQGSVLIDDVAYTQFLYVS